MLPLVAMNEGVKNGGRENAAFGENLERLLRAQDLNPFVAVNPLQSLSNDIFYKESINKLPSDTKIAFDSTNKFKKCLIL